MYLRLLLVLKSTVTSELGLAVMNSLMNPRSMTTTSLSTVCVPLFLNILLKLYHLYGTQYDFQSPLGHYSRHLNRIYLLDHL